MKYYGRVRTHHTQARTHARKHTHKSKKVERERGKGKGMKCIRKKEKWWEEREK